jgi:hypothetical protein
MSEKECSETIMFLLDSACKGLQKLIVACSRGVDRFKKEFSIKDAICNLAKAWTD